MAGNDLWVSYESDYHFTLDWSHSIKCMQYSMQLALLLCPFSNKHFLTIIRGIWSSSQYANNMFYVGENLVHKKHVYKCYFKYKSHLLLFSRVYGMSVIIICVNFNSWTKSLSMIGILKVCHLKFFLFCLLLLSFKVNLSQIYMSLTLFFSS